MLKYLSSRVWIKAERSMLVYLKTGHKRGRVRMKVQVRKDHHTCLRCPYNSKCETVCKDLENMAELAEKVKEEFGINSFLLQITPLEIERLRAKW